MTDFYKINELGDISRTDGVPIEPKTMEEMCNLISEVWMPNVTAKKIYEYSPTGELYMIFEWYLQSLELAVKKGLCK